MRRSLAILLTGALLLAGSLAFVSVASAATFGPTVRCSNAVDNGGGEGLICAVTITNTITASGGTARVTIRECHGGAGDPTAACEVTTRNLTEPVTRVSQCNGSAEGGGSTLRCSVRITNNFVDIDPGESGVTINQCVGSGDGFTGNCDPTPANTTGAAITQCNGSANGGTLVRLECTATGTESPAFRTTINQCNGSANGGGGLVICSANIENNEVAGAPAPTPTPGGGGGGGSTPPPTDTLATTDISESGPTPVVLLGIFLLAFLALVVGISRRSPREIRNR